MTPLLHSQLAGETITRNYATSGMIGRPTGLGVDTEYTASYGYDPATGRFASIGWNAGGASGSVAYGYLPNSNLLQNATFSTGQVTTYGYEATRNLKTQVKNEFNTTLISQYDYGYDTLGRRKGVQNSGSAFITPAFNVYGYNDRNELTTSNRYLGTDLNNLGQPVDEQNRAFGYDTIGNRKTTTTWDQAKAVATQLTYTANQLNQYDLITTGNGAEETPGYDEDGNMIERAGAYYGYDAENRLLWVEAYDASGNETGQEFSYDYLGRRVLKHAWKYDGSSWVNSETRYLYDGWNLLEEITIRDTSAPTSDSTFYVWGLDLSQSLQGAGGVGGLLARIADGGYVTYSFDANGNVGQLLDESGNVAAHYEYDPYGNQTHSTGMLSEGNPFRFSSKYFEAEVGLYYYGHRYYSPELGRWLNRDPIEEEGGLNLYNFVQNDPADLTDILGKDFIALAARPLDIPYLDLEERRHVGINFHTSIEYWKCPCTIGTSGEVNNFTLKTICSQEGSFKSVELLKSSQKWWAWEQIKNENWFFGGPTHFWKKKQVGVSIVSFGTSTGKTLQVFYEPDQKHGSNASAVLSEWERIKEKSIHYKFAEAEDFAGYFKNWPNSNYQVTGNNCHTFAQHIIRPHNIPDIFGYMLGNDTPKNVNDAWGGRSPIPFGNDLGAHP